MSQKLVLIHTVPSLVDVFHELCQEILPNVQIIHVADQILLTHILEQGRPSPAIYQRVAEHVVAAQAVGANAVLCTCSSISPCVEVARPMVSIPVLKVDEAMVDRAIELGEDIGVIATVSTTLGPTAELVQERASVAGKAVRVKSVLCEGAYDALFAGDPETHDNIVLDHLRKLMAQVDVVLLAQASMARVLDKIPEEERKVPILSSPRLAVERAREVLA
jgi:Asp/Glu/hydantoin racemase